jgi:hypothetical protein
MAPFLNTSRVSKERGNVEVEDEILRYAQNDKGQLRVLVILYGIP